MLKNVTMYTVICDNCGVDVNEDAEYSAWNDKGYAEETAMNADWIREVSSMEEDKHYCPDCAYYNDEDVLIIKEERKGINAR